MKKYVTRKLWTLLALAAVAICAFESGARAQLFYKTSGATVRSAGLLHKIMAPKFQRKQGSVFSMKRIEPPTKSVVANSLLAKVEKSELDELLEAVNVAASVGSLLDLSLRYPEKSVLNPLSGHGSMRINSEKFV